MPRPSLNGLVETCLYVTDVVRSRDFYTGVFGFAALGGNERIQPLAVRDGQVLILFRRGGTLGPVQTDGGIIPPHDGGGEQHFAFGIEDESYEDWKTFIVGLDIAIESEVRWPAGGRSLYFRDPDRLLVELITRRVWPNY